MICRKVGLDGYRLIVCTCVAPGFEVDVEIFKLNISLSIQPVFFLREPLGIKALGWKLEDRACCLFAFVSVVHS